MVARRNGVVAEEFGIFFPPRLFKKRIKSRRGDFDFTINLLPLGGFVRMQGEHDSDTKKGSFGAANLWAKSKIMIAGVVMNLVIALILFTILALVGIPKLVPNQFTIKSDTKIVKNEILAGYVEPHSPAAKAGLANSDKVLAIGPVGHVSELNRASDLGKLTERYAGQDVQLVYQAKGSDKKVTKSVHLLSDAAVKDTKKGHLGVAPISYQWQRSTWSAPVVAVGLTGQLTEMTFVGLGHALGGLGGIVAGGLSGNHSAREQAQTEASSQVTGPVGIFEILKNGSSLGWRFMLMIIAVVSLALAIMNFLPIPALDGGRLWWTLGAHAIKRPMTARVEEIINATGFMVLIVLFILITIVDIKRF